MGDTYTVDGHTPATNRAPQRQPAPDGNERIVRFGLELHPIEWAGETRFGPVPIRIGAAVEFATADYVLQSRVVQLGTADIETADTPIVHEASVPAATLDDIQSGDTFDVDGDPDFLVPALADEVIDVTSEDG